MTFDLTDSLAQQILYSMENQDCCWLVDAQAGVVASTEDDGVDSDDYDRFYAIPEWTSDDGFELLRDFTNNLHSPLAREDLKRALNGGRGVFRRFKDVVKSYPEVERMFFVFKNKAMKKRLMEWYNALRESWGMEKLAVSDSGIIEETDELVQDDFVFCEYSPATDGVSISCGCDFVAEEYSRQFSFETGQAIAFLWKRLSAISDAEGKVGFVCRTQSDEFTGCFLVSFCPPSAKRTVLVTDFFVLQDYRGLGIGKELVSKSFAKLKETGIQWVLISNTIVPESMEPLLVRFGFDRLGSGYLADLSKTSF